MSEVGEGKEVCEREGRGERDDGAEMSEEEESGMAANHKELARDMFEKITDYLNGELAGMDRCACLGKPLMP